MQIVTGNKTKDIGRQMRKIIQNAKKIALFGHRYPDGDCLGSMLGRGGFLEILGKDVDYFVPTQFYDDFLFMHNIEKIQIGFTPNQKNYDIVFFLDTANHNQQLGNIRNKNSQYFEQHPQKIVIDHHVSNTGYGNINLINSKASSTCELIAFIIHSMISSKVYNTIVQKTQIMETIANNLLLGISTDTGHFRRSTNANTIKIVGRLLQQGASMERVHNNMYASNSLHQIYFMQNIAQRIQKKGPIVYTWYTQTERKKQGLEHKSIDHVLDILTSIKHDGIFLFFKGYERKTPPFLRCSWRTKNNTINVSILAKHFQGGGHTMAAGSQMAITKDFQTSMNIFLKKAEKIFFSHYPNRHQ